MSTTPPAGWYADPGGTPSQRWWDGQQWSEHTQPDPVAGDQTGGWGGSSSPDPSDGYADPAGGGFGGSAGGDFGPNDGYGAGRGLGGPRNGLGGLGNRGFGARGRGGYRNLGPPDTGSFGQRNRLSLTAIGFGLVYVLIALVSHFVFLGIVPVLMTVRAFRRGERLAPIAAIVAAVAVILSLAALAH